MLPAELNQKYEVRGTLGAGAMGTVYDAVDRIIERRVAIKVVRKPPGDDPESREAAARFRREAQAAGRLTHPSIVAVYDYGENADQDEIRDHPSRGALPHEPESGLDLENRTEAFEEARALRPPVWTGATIAHWSDALARSPEPRTSALPREGFSR